MDDGIRRCGQCDVEFTRTVTYGDARAKGKTFCGPGCRQAWLNENYPDEAKSCAQCGKAYAPTGWHMDSRFPDVKFCGHACQRDWVNSLGTPVEVPLSVTTEEPVKEGEPVNTPLNPGEPDLELTIEQLHKDKAELKRLLGIAEQQRDHSDHAHRRAMGDLARYSGRESLWDKLFALAFVEVSERVAKLATEENNDEVIRLATRKTCEAVDMIVEEVRKHHGQGTA